MLLLKRKQVRLVKRLFISTFCCTFCFSVTSCLLCPLFCSLVYSWKQLILYFLLRRCSRRKQIKLVRITTLLRCAA